MTISPDQERIEAIGDQLRAKIGSKFTASSFFAGFALTVLSGQIFALFQASTLPPTFAVAIGVAFAAVVLFVEAIISLDELTMPKRFWRENPGASSEGLPPQWGCLTGEDLWNLQKHMIFFWYALTVVAMVVTALAVLLMLAPLRHVSVAEVQRWSFCAAVLGLLLGTVYGLMIRLIASRRFPGFNRPVD